MVDSYAHAHYTPPCFEGVGPLHEDDVLATHRHGEGSSYPVFLSEAAVRDPHQYRDGSIYTGTGAMHKQCKVSLWDLELTKPPSQTYEKFLGMEPTDA